MNPEEVVQKQVDAYNQRDLTEFVACHDPAVELFSFSESTPYAVGQEKLKEIYGTVFEKSPNLHAEIINRIVMGNKVIDHEKVTGRIGVELSEIIAIYEVEDGLIAKAHFIRKNSV